MAMQHSETMHDFWYQNSHRRTYQTVSYVEEHFFSYATEIGAIVRARGQLVGLVADQTFSSTTAGHLSILRRACPFVCIEVPFDWNDDFTMVSQNKMLQTLRKRFMNEIRGKFSNKYYPKRKQTVRRDCEELLARFQYFMEKVDIPINSRELAVINKLNKLIEETPENIEKWKEERQKVAKATRLKDVREKQAKQRKERKENKTRVAVRAWLETVNPDMEELLKVRYSKQFTIPEQFPDNVDKIEWSVCNQELDKALEKQVEADMPWRENSFSAYRYQQSPSFVWVNGDAVKTSQGVTLPIREVAVVYKAWRRGKVGEGMHVGPYTIRELTDKYVQIGCHCISMKNINILGKTLEAINA